MVKENDLTELVTRLKDAAGNNLVSVILYGSAVTGDFHEGHSDLNILSVTNSLSSDDLAKLHDASAWWVKKGHPAPLFLTEDELYKSADVFAIEFLDMVRAYQILHGRDVVSPLDIPLGRHRMQVERELRNNTLRLRQQYLKHPADDRRTLELMTSSISSFAALFRHALIALGEEREETKRGAVDRLAKVLEFDPAPFHTIIEIREGGKRAREVDVHATFRAYLNRVADVANEMDRRLGS